MSDINEHPLSDNSIRRSKGWLNNFTEKEFDALSKSCGNLNNEQAYRLQGMLESMMRKRNWVRRNLGTRVANGLNENHIYTKEEFIETFSRPGRVTFDNLGKASREEIKNALAGLTEGR